MKLSRPMISVLEQAYFLAHGSIVERHWNMNNIGWFVPQYHECAKIIARYQTCVALRRRGLLDWRVVGYHKHRGDWKTDYEYRINEYGAAIVTCENCGKLIARGICNNCDYN